MRSSVLPFAAMSAVMIVGAAARTGPCGPTPLNARQVASGKSIYPRSATVAMLQKL